MNRIRVATAIALTLVITVIASPISSASTKPKSAGRTSSSIPNTILNGKGVPLSTLGIDGDFYIDTRSLLIYGPKKNKKWPLPQSLQGPIGASGTDGKNGSEGKIISSTSNVVGPSGTQGEKGDKGDKGEAGTSGAAGVTGATGATGATGSSGSGGGTVGPAGAQGPAGSAGTQGVIGATGAKGETGTVGSLGATGAKGETGTVGAVGPSNVYKGNFNFPDISGSDGTSQVAGITGFKAGKSYLLNLSIVTFQPTRNSDNLLSTGLSITTNVGTPNVWYSYQSTNGISLRTGIGSDRYESVTIVQVTLDGSSSIDYSINLQLSIGIDTTTYFARSEVSYVATLVGSIGTL